MASVLIVEDEVNLAKGIQFNLELEGYRVEVIGDGTEALARLTAPGREALDLVILDIMLPGMDGLAVADGMRKAGNFIPILMLTAKSLPGRRGARAGGGGRRLPSQALRPRRAARAGQGAAAAEGLGAGRRRAADRAHRRGRGGLPHLPDPDRRARSCP